ncbi:hypothetical protein PDE_01493 [Penicillium oxalicum 114-2]|uniref:Transcription factor domain-containing protein n=1 Tax=Penicillium oxalicum (strain 114-2 / CGMCC 5302) TaxID=933388 RepID=S7ZCZ1_PENO1|nr:hypothetical protein PDE_01493 [Penicillium oxalicum 114-2]
MATQADPELRAEVDCMILDYLACLAIERTLSAAEDSTRGSAQGDEVNWMVEPVQAFKSAMTTAYPETLLPRDLEIKIQILSIAHHFWNYPDHTAKSSCPQESNPSASSHPTTGTNDRPPRPHLASIGIDFVEMCSVAVSKVSHTRWFDLGGRFMLQARMEEHREGHVRTAAIPWFYAWMPNSPDLREKWTVVRDRYAAELPQSPSSSLSSSSMASFQEKANPMGNGTEEAWRQAQDKFPFVEFKRMVIMFLVELMMTLDQPILLQLECGKLGHLTVAETSQLMERIGIR